MNFTQLLDKLKDLQKGLDQPMTSPYGPIYPIVQFQEFTKLLPVLLTVIETQREALESTSKNSCCDTCQEAKRVALSALAQCEKVTQEGMK